MRRTSGRTTSSRSPARLRPGVISVLAVALVAAPTLTRAPDARANGYEVHACDSGAASAANNSFAAQADLGMTAYSDCPAGQGMTARNAYDNGQTGQYQGAYLIFDAPPGTSVGSMAFDAGVQRHNCSYDAAVVASNHDLGGAVSWGLPPGQNCDSWQTNGTTAYFPNRWDVPIGAPRVRLEVRCVATSCPRNGVTAIRLRNVVVRVEDDTPPQLSAGRGALWLTGGWLSGTQAAGFTATDGAGIRDTAVTVDGSEVAHQNNGCDFTQRTPCPQGGMDAQIATSAFADGPHVLSLVAEDTAGNRATVSRTVLIDNSPPDAPTGLTLDGGDGWRRSNSFDVHWSDPSAGNGAGVAGAEWQLCPVASGSACRRGRRDGAGLSSISGLSVPDAGAWTLKLWLVDAAGNQDPRLAAPALTLRYDATSPDVAIAPLTADDPTLITAPAHDQGSGIAGGQIELRRSGSLTWIPVPTSVADGALSGRIDDEHLADGGHEVRVTAVDGAGNQSVSQTYTDGSGAQIRLPLRLKTQLAAGFAEPRRGGVRLARAAYTGFGRVVRVRGRLRTPEGNPMVGAVVNAFSQVRDGRSPARLIATAKTSRTGRFTFRILKGPNRVVRVVYRGAPQIRGASRALLVFVRAATTIRPNQHRFVNGETVRFSGQVRTGRIPAQGKLIELKVWIRGRWRTFATTHADRRGRWAYDYRFDGTVGSQQYRFRAAIPDEAGYPFAAGQSRIVRVEVRGT